MLRAVGRRVPRVMEDYWFCHIIAIPVGFSLFSFLFFSPFSLSTFDFARRLAAIAAHVAFNKGGRKYVIQGNE